MKKTVATITLILCSHSALAAHTPIGVVARLGKKVYSKATEKTVSCDSLNMSGIPSSPTAGSMKLLSDDAALTWQVYGYKIPSDATDKPDEKTYTDFDCNAKHDFKLLGTLNASKPDLTVSCQDVDYVNLCNVQDKEATYVCTQACSDKTELTKLRIKKDK